MEDFLHFVLQLYEELRRDYILVHGVITVDAELLQLPLNELQGVGSLKQTGVAELHDCGHLH